MVTVNWHRLYSLLKMSATYGCLLAVLGFGAAAQAQPDSEACIKAKQAVVDLQKQIAQVQAEIDKEKGTDINSFPLQQERKGLEDQLSALEGYRFKVCAYTPPPPETGTIHPFYEILTLLYAPPGYTAPSQTPTGQPAPANNSPSSADYGAESKLGTAITTEKSFKNGYTISAELSGSAFGTGTSLAFSQEMSAAQDDKSSLELTKDTKSDLKANGPPTDGIDHDYDLFWLSLNTEIDTSSQTGAITWALKDPSPALIEVSIYVRCLKAWIAGRGQTKVMGDDLNNACVNDWQNLSAHGFTNTDFQNILNADPFANGTPDLTSGRFVELSTTFPYTNLLGQTQQSAPQTYFVSNESKQTNTHTKTHDLQDTITVSATVAGPGVSTKLSFQNQMTWTYSTSKAVSTDGTDSITLSVYSPSVDYVGPITMGAYYDLIWRTYVFVPLSLDGTPVDGAVHDSRGNPAPFTKVRLVSSGVRMTTYTDAKGHFAFASRGLAKKARLSFSAVGAQVVRNYVGLPVHLKLTQGMLKPKRAKVS